MSTFAPCLRQAAMAAGTSSTASATQAGPDQSQSGCRSCSVPLRQRVTGAVWNSYHQSFHSPPFLKPKSFW
jgi:hypothetical protein